MKNIKSILLSLFSTLVLSSCNGLSSTFSSFLIKTSLISAKTITSEEAINVKLEEEQLANLASFTNQSIHAVRLSSNQNFAFSPISYYLNLSTIYSLTTSNYQSSISILGANSKADLSSFVNKVSKRIYEFDENPNNPKRIVSSNLIADYVDAFDQSSITNITEDLYCSYVNDYSTLNEDLERFAKNVSNGNVVSYNFPKPKAGQVSFISGLYVDVSYPLFFSEKNTINTSFNGNGSFTFYKGDQYATKITQSNDYLAFQLGSIRFVKPLNTTLDSFFETRGFSECFENNNEQEYKITLSIPKVGIDSSIDMIDIARNTGLCKEKDMTFNQKLDCYSVDSLVQNNYVSFTHQGIKAYTSTSAGIIPYMSPVIELALDSSFAFEILGRDNIVLYYGEVTSLN